MTNDRRTFLSTLLVAPAAVANPNPTVTTSQEEHRRRREQEERELYSRMAPALQAAYDVAGSAEKAVIREEQWGRECYHPEEFDDWAERLWRLDRLKARYEDRYGNSDAFVIAALEQALGR
jgi:hypothetical protein